MKYLLALTLIVASGFSLGAQQLSGEFTPDYDYRIVHKEWPDGHWSMGVHKVFYYPGTDKQALFEISEHPVTITGATKKEVKRELRLFAEASQRPVIDDPIVGIFKEQK